MYTYQALSNSYTHPLFSAQGKCPRQVEIKLDYSPSALEKLSYIPFTCLSPLQLLRPIPHVRSETADEPLIPTLSFAFQSSRGNPIPIFSRLAVSISEFFHCFASHLTNQKHPLTYLSFVIHAKHILHKIISSNHFPHQK